MQGGRRGCALVTGVWRAGPADGGRMFSGLRRRKGVVVFSCVGAVLLLAACTGKTTGGTNLSNTSITLNATGRCDSGERCTWYWEYWKAAQPRSTSTKTAVFGPVNGPTGDVKLSIKRCAQLHIALAQLTGRRIHVRQARGPYQFLLQVLKVKAFFPGGVVGPLHL